MSERLTRILLVEDNPGDAKLLQVVLDEDPAGSFRHEMVHVSTLSEATQSISRAPFDVVLLDLSLPDALGLDSVVGVREIAPAMPMVVLTSLDDEMVGRAAVRHGAQDYLIKGQVDRAMLTRAMSYAIERKRIEAELRLQHKRQAMLYETNLAITSTLDSESVLNALLDKIADLMPDLAMSIWLLDSSAKGLVPINCRGLDETAWKSIPHTSDAGVATVLATKRPVVLAEIDAGQDIDARDFVQRNRLVSYIGIPLLAGVEVLGVLSFYSKARQEIVDDDLNFLKTLAGQAAIAIQNSKLYEAIKRSQQQLQGFSASLLSAREEERASIAREIHDQFGQALTALKFDLGRLGQKLPDERVDLKQILAGAMNTIDQIIDVARQVSRKLRSRVLDTLGLAAAVESQLKEFQSRTGVHWTFDSNMQNVSLEQHVSTGLFRILQEALTNVARHAGAQNLQVTLTRSDEELLLVIKDDGRGIDPSEVSNLNAVGLIGMRERGRLLGGEVTISGTPGDGTVVWVKAPIKDLDSTAVAGSL